MVGGHATGGDVLFDRNSQAVLVRRDGSAAGCPELFPDTRPASPTPDGSGQRICQSREVERIAYPVPETARALGLSTELIYDELRSNRLGSVPPQSRTRSGWPVPLDP